MIQAMLSIGEECLAALCLMHPKMCFAWFGYQGTLLAHAELLSPALPGPFLLSCSPTTHLPSVSGITLS